MPLGALFGVLGLLLTLYGAATRGQPGTEPTGVPIDLIWGVVLFAFGLWMLLLAAARGRRPRCSLHDGDHFGGEYQMKLLTLGLAVPLFVAAAPAAGAQEAPKAPEALQVGADAPDFALPGATRYGVLRNPIHLSDFKGKTVVLAFFYKARTKG